MALWDAVEALALRGPSVRELRLHRLHLIAARALHRRGDAVPDELRSAARWTAAATLAVPFLLARVRAACDGPLVLMKGPEAGARYPDPALRPFHDLDLLAAEPERVHAALLAAGFVPIGDPELYEGIHHLRPVALPGLPLTVEVHSRPKWPLGMAGPDARELISCAVPSATGVEGVLAPPPAHHAVLIAAHSWAHNPLGAAGHLVDVAAVAAEADPAEAAALARRWGCRRLWGTTVAATEALVAGGREPAALRIWARHLAAARERTVLESHATRLAGQVWGMPGGMVPGAAAATLFTTARRADGEPWADKLRRTRQAVADAFVARSEHEAKLGRRRA